MSLTKAPSRFASKLSKESLHQELNFDKSSLVFGWYNSTTVRLAQSLPDAIHASSYSKPSFIAKKQNRCGGMTLPPLNLKDALLNSPSRKGSEKQKTQSSRERISARRSVFGDWYMPPSQWQKIHTARNWATENDVEPSVLDSLLQREEQEDDSAVTLSELKKQEKQLSKKMETETYVVSSFKEFVKRNGYRQPHFLKRIKTPNTLSMKKTKCAFEVERLCNKVCRNEIAFAAQSNAPLRHADSFVPELADFLSANSGCRLSKARSW